MMMVQIAGRLGADPQVRYTPSNQKVTAFNVAVSVYQSGKEDTAWWRVTVWGDRFDKMMNYLKKGSAVIVTGTMKKPELWTNRDGNQQISLEMTAEMINFSPFGKAENSPTNQQENNMSAEPLASASPAMAAVDASPSVDSVDDDLPF